MSQPEPAPQQKSPESKLVTFAKELYEIWIAERPAQYAAALAYYAIFSFVPVIYIAFTITNIVVSRLAVEEQFYTQVASVLGTEIAQAVQQAVANLATRTTSTSPLISIIGFLALAFSASLIFFQLQHALNTIWKVPPPKRGQTRAYALNRLLAFAMVLGVVLMLIAATVVNALISLISSVLPWGGPASVGSFVGLALLAAVAFALIFRVLPNARVAWRPIWLGAGAAALLLAIGITLVKLYLSASRFSTAFEAAGAVAVLLMAFYYIGQIFVLGALIVRVYASMSGSEIVPRQDHSA
jgi:membrane protein